MSRLAGALVIVARDLDELSVKWALVGGLAVSSWCEPRLTRDIDVAVSVTTDPDAERLVRDLRRRGYETIELIEQEATARLATARLVRREGTPIFVDLLFASSGIEAEIVESASVTEIFADVRAPVAGRAHLIALKLLSREDRARPQDHDDLLALLGDATDSDLAEARQCAALIMARGFHRGRDLPAMLDEILRR